MKEKSEHINLHQKSSIERFLCCHLIILEVAISKHNNGTRVAITIMQRPVQKALS